MKKQLMEKFAKSVIHQTQLRAVIGGGYENLCDIVPACQNSSGTFVRGCGPGALFNQNCNYCIRFYA